MDEPTQGGENRELEQLEQLMQDPEISEAAGLVLAAWRLYWLARSNLISVSNGRINDRTFATVSEALAKSACSGFKVGRFKNQVKRTVLPFLQRLAHKEAMYRGDKNAEIQQPEG